MGLSRVAGAVLMVAGAGVIAVSLLSVPAESLPGAAPAGPVHVSSTATPVTGEGVVRSAQAFSMVGVRWTGNQPDRIEMRANAVGGKWSEWTELEPTDAQRGRPTTTTEPVWTGPSRDVQIRAHRAGRPAADGLEVITIDPGSSPADARLGTQAVPGRPNVVSRAQWGADESLMTWSPEYSTTTKAVTIHHTAGTNVYSCSQSAGIVRGIYRYHAVTNGWGDIGYNALVDACGTIFEGRAGGLDVPTIGAHAGGFNAYTFGISLMGEFGSVAPTDAALEATSAMAAWKLAGSYRDARGSTVLVSTGGGTSKYPAGTAVTLPTIFGHRDVGNTACPGNSGYAQLERIRTRVVELAGDWRSSTIYAKWQALGGESGSLGGVYQLEQPLAGGGRGTYFAGGDGTTITSHPQAGTHYVRGEIRRKWVTLGGVNYGYPTTDETPTQGVTGYFSDFATGRSIYWSPAGGAHDIGGLIKTRWLQSGGASGVFGFPVTDEFAFDDGTRRQDFTRVTIVYNPGTRQFQIVPRRPGGGWPR